MRRYMGARLSSLGASRRRSKETATCAPTPVDDIQAMALKDLGNEHFRAGKFKEAEQLYSQACANTLLTYPELWAANKTSQYTARFLKCEIVFQQSFDPYKATRLGRRRGGQSDGDPDIR